MRPLPSSPDFATQYQLEEAEYLKRLDFLNWYRFYFLFRDLLSCRSQRVLEIGGGSGVLKNCVAPHVEKYEMFDINERLKPDYLGDVRTRIPALTGRYDTIVAADVLEHLPFADLPDTLANLRSYLVPGGRAFITIPHRASYFLFMTPSYIPHVIRIATGFLSLGAFYRRFIKRKIWTDPYHCWEIGDGTIDVRQVEALFHEACFTIVSRKTLLYVDYWILSAVGEKNNLESLSGKAKIP